MVSILIVGWIIVTCVILALLNYLLKQISREYVKKLPSQYKDFADAYRRFMQRMIRAHRYFGFASIVFLCIHVVLIAFISTVSLTGIITAAWLIAVVMLGIYGFYIKKDLRSWWLKVHRLCAFFLLLSVLVHIFYKHYLYL